MTPTLRTLLIAAAFAVGVACDALAILFHAPGWALAGQLPIIAMLLLMSHALGTTRSQVRTAIALINGTRREADKPPLTQDDYAAVLEADKGRQRTDFGMTNEGAYCLRCTKSADLTAVRHPIWDGPFEGSGSGAVDVRRVWWCRRCDGLLPIEAGRPIRLPYLDTEPIALLPALYERNAFHRLGQRVIRAAPLPPMPTHAFDGRSGSICDICGYAKDDARHGVAL